MPSKHAQKMNRTSSLTISTELLMEPEMYYLVKMNRTLSQKCWVSMMKSCRPSMKLLKKQNSSTVIEDLLNPIVDSMTNNTL